MGGDMVFGDGREPAAAEGSSAPTWAGATNRVEHVRQCLPEICTLDCGTMNFAEADYVMTNTPGMLRAMGGMMTAMGVKPEIEAFDTRPSLVRQAARRREGVLKPDALVRLCMGVPWGAPDDLNTFMAMVNNVPTTWTLLRPSRSAATRWPVRRRRCLPAAMSASGWRTISGSTRACSPPMRSWSSAPPPSSRISARRDPGPEEVRKKLNSDQRWRQLSPRRLERSCEEDTRMDTVEGLPRRMKELYGDEDYEFLTAHEIDYAAKTWRAAARCAGRRSSTRAFVRLQDHKARPLAAGGDPRLARRRRYHRLDRLRACCMTSATLAPYNHDEYAASILEAAVREQCTWVVESMATSGASIMPRPTPAATVMLA